MSVQVGTNKKSIFCVINIAVSKGFTFSLAALQCYNSLMSKHSSKLLIRKDASLNSTDSGEYRVKK